MDLTLDVPLAKFESEELLDLNENNKPFDKEKDKSSRIDIFSEKFSHSLEDLVSSFDEKVLNCLKDYRENVENIAPTQNRKENQSSDCSNWWTLTGNYGPFLPIDWDKTFTRNCLPTPKPYGCYGSSNGGNDNDKAISCDGLCNDISCAKTSRYDKRSHRKINLHRISPFTAEIKGTAAAATLPHLQNGRPEGTRHDYSSIIPPNSSGLGTTGQDLVIPSSSSSSSASSEEIQIETADEVIKEIDRIMKDSPTASQDSGVTPELYGHYYEIGTDAYENDSAKYSSFIEPFIPYSPEDLEDLYPLNKLVDVEAQLKTYVQEQSECLIHELAYRDDLEYHKELLNTFISLLVTLQNKKQRLVVVNPNYGGNTQQRNNFYENGKSYNSGTEYCNNTSPTNASAASIISSPMSLLNKLQGLVVNNKKSIVMSSSNNQTEQPSTNNAILIDSKRFDESMVDEDMRMDKNKEKFQPVLQIFSQANSRSDEDTTTTTLSTPFSNLSSPPPPPPPPLSLEALFNSTNFHAFPTQTLPGTNNFSVTRCWDESDKPKPDDFLTEKQFFSPPIQHKSVHSNTSSFSSSFSSTSPTTTNESSQTHEKSETLCCNGTVEAITGPMDDITSPNNTVQVELEAASNTFPESLVDGKYISIANFLNQQSSSHCKGLTENYIPANNVNQRDITLNPNGKKAKPVSLFTQKFHASATSISSSFSSFLPSRKEDFKGSERFSAANNRLTKGGLAGLSSKINGSYHHVDFVTRKSPKFMQFLQNLDIKSPIFDKTKAMLISKINSNNREGSFSYSSLEDKSIIKSSPGSKGKYITTIIPYNFDMGPPNVLILQILIKLLNAILEDDDKVPSLLTDYILKVICPSPRPPPTITSIE